MATSNPVLVCCSEMPEFEQSFSFACPKFLSPVPPNYDTVQVLNFHKVSKSLLLNIELLVLTIHVHVDNISADMLQVLSISRTKTKKAFEKLSNVQTANQL